MHKKMKDVHFDFENIETFIRSGIYPVSKSSNSKDFGSKSNFGRVAKKFDLKDGLFYHGEKLVIKERGHQTEIISDM